MAASPSEDRLPCAHVFVAGAAGFIGSHFVERLLTDGHRVTAVDDLITGRYANIVHLRAHPRFRFLHHDIARPLDIVEPVQWVAHLASPASPPQYQTHPIETLEANSLGTHNLLRLACVHDASFLLASTSEIYGDPLQHPQHEEHWGNVNPNGPRSMYDEGKRYAEAATMTFHRHHGLPVRIVRIFNTYGPRMAPDDGRIVTTFIRQALRNEPITIFGDGSQTRSLQYVSDLIEGIARCMARPHCCPINLGNPMELSVVDIARRIIRLTGSGSTIVHLPLPQDDPKRRRPDIGRARRLLDWMPEMSLDDGLLRTIDACRREITCSTNTPVPASTDARKQA